MSAGSSTLVALSLAVALFTHVRPAQAQRAPIEVAIYSPAPRPNVFYITTRPTWSPLRLERLPGHLRAAWQAHRSVSGRFERRIRQRASALGALDDRWRDRLGDENEEPAAYQRERRAALERFRDIAGLEAEVERGLDTALALARRAHPEHGLAQLALAELELERAALDYQAALERFDAERGEGPEPPLAPAFERAAQAAERASHLLHGAWQTEALFALGYLRLEMEQREAGVDAFERGFALPPSRMHGQMALRLAELHFEEERWEPAWTLYQRALELTTNPHIAWIARYKLVWTAYHLGRFDEARAAIVALFGPPDPENALRDRTTTTEVLEIVLPLALAAAHDPAGASLSPEMNPEARARVLAAVARRAAEVGDTAAGRAALGALRRVAEPGSLAARELDVIERILDRPRSEQQALDGWLRSTLRRCDHVTSEPRSLVLRGHFGPRGGYTDVEGEPALRACLIEHYGARRARGVPFVARIDRR